MLKSLIAVLSSALKTAAGEIRTATQAHAYYQVQPLTKVDKAFYWLIGFTRGTSLAMQDLRKHNIHRPAFEPDAEIEVQFQASALKRPVLMVEVLQKVEGGTAIPVISTLNYVEAQAVLSGLNILRGTGVYHLSDAQADEFIREASSMLGPSNQRSTWKASHRGQPVTR
jgi:hypothetical protein